MGGCSVSSDHCVGLRDGSHLTIRFLPSDPGVNHPATWEGPEGDWWAPCIPSAAMTAICIWFLISLHRRSQLLAEGLPAAGVVVSSDRGWTTWVSKYQFRTADGQVEAGSDAKRLEVGATICVLYSPKNPQRNCVYLA